MRCIALLMAGMAMIAATTRASPATRASSSTATPAVPPPLWTIPNTAGLELFRQARFGLFVHWGPISQWGDEISFPLACKSLPCTVQGPNRSSVTLKTTEELAAHREAYVELAKTFNPMSLDLPFMANLSHSAGMRYVSWVVVHCDGFSNFETNLTDYKITNTPYGRDLFAEVGAAFSAQGMRVGAYYCPSIWTNNAYWAPNATVALGGCCSPTYDPLAEPGNWTTFLEYFHGQLRELAAGYKPTHFWIDSGSTLPEVDTRVEAVLEDMRSANPDVVVQVRGNGPFRDYSEAGDHTETEVHSVFGSSSIATGPDRVFEVPMTIGQQWAFSPDAVYKTAPVILWDLLAVASHGGNLLLNIGPGPDGSWASEAIQTLNGLASWMAFAGDIVEGTVTDPVYPYEWISSGGDHAGWHFYCFYRRDGAALYVVAMPDPDPATTNTQAATPVTAGSASSASAGGDSSSILLPFVKPELLARAIQSVSILGAGPAGSPLQADHTLGPAGLLVNYSVPPLSASIGSYWSDANQDQAPCATRGCDIYTRDSYVYERAEGACFVSSTSDASVPIHLFFKGSVTANSTADDNCFAAAGGGPEGYTDERLACYAVPLTTTNEHISSALGVSGLELDTLSQYWSESRQDRWTLASDASRTAAESQGYIHEKDIAKVLSATSAGVLLNVSPLSWNAAIEIAF